MTDALTDVYMEVPLDKITDETVAPNGMLLDSLQMTETIVNVVYLTLDPENEGMYRILSGRRRIWALRAMGVKTVQAIIREVDDEEFHTQSLMFNSGAPNYMGEAEHIARLKDHYKHTFEEIAQLVNMSDSTVFSRYEITIKLIPEFKERLKDGRIRYSTTLELIKLPPHKQQELLASVGEKKVTTKRVKEAVSEHKSEKVKQAFENFQLELPDGWGDGDPNLSQPRTAGLDQEDEHSVMATDLLALRTTMVDHEWGKRTNKTDQKFIVQVHKLLDEILQEYLS